MTGLFRPAADPRGEDAPTGVVVIALLVGAGFAFSAAFACATPFAALATVAMLRLNPRQAFAAVTLAWIVNQADGFLFKHYPQTWNCVGWGLAIWLAATMAAVGALASNRILSRASLAVRGGSMLAGAFVAYEGVLAIVTAVSSASTNAFAALVVIRILAINVAAFALLLALAAIMRAAESVRFVPRPDRQSAPAADI